MDGLSQLLHKTTYIVASPILNIGKAMIHTLIELLVWNLLACYRIRIEIIVDVYAVNVVAVNNVVHDAADIITVGRYAGVEDEEAVVCEHTLGMLYRHMAGGKFLSALVLARNGLSQA